MVHKGLTDMGVVQFGKHYRSFYFIYFGDMQYTIYKHRDKEIQHCPALEGW